MELQYNNTTQLVEKVTRERKEHSFPRQAKSEHIKTMEDKRKNFNIKSVELSSRIIPSHQASQSNQLIKLLTDKSLRDHANF